MARRGVFRKKTGGPRLTRIKKALLCYCREANADRFVSLRDGLESRETVLFHRKNDVLFLIFENRVVLPRFCVARR